jgi:hypothetical protein
MRPLHPFRNTSCHLPEMLKTAVWALCSECRDFYKYKDCTPFSTIICFPHVTSVVFVCSLTQPNFFPFIINVKMASRRFISFKPPIVLNLLPRQWTLSKKTNPSLCRSCTLLLLSTPLNGTSNPLYPNCLNLVFFSRHSQILLRPKLLMTCTGKIKRFTNSRNMNNSRPLQPHCLGFLSRRDQIPHHAKFLVLPRLLTTHLPVREFLAHRMLSCSSAPTF